MSGPGGRRRRRAERGFSLLEVLVALAIVAIAVFPLLQIVEKAETAAFDAKFTSLACGRIRALLSSITATAVPGDYGDGDLADLSDEEGYDARLAFTNIVYEWNVEAIDLSSDIVPEDEEEEEDFFSNEDTDPLKDPEEEEEIDERFRARYVKISIFYQLNSGEERELVVETFVPPLPKETDRIADAVPPNPGT